MIIRLSLAEAAAATKADKPYPTVAALFNGGRPVAAFLLVSPGVGVNLFTGDILNDIVESDLSPCCITLDSTSVVKREAPAEKPLVVPAPAGAGILLRSTGQASHQ